MPELPQVIFVLEDSSDEYGGPIRSISRLQAYLHDAGITSGHAVPVIGRAPPAERKSATLENTMTTGQLFKGILGVKLAAKGAVIIFNNQWTVMVQAMGLLCLVLGIPYIWWIRGVPTFKKLSLKRIIWLLSQKKLLLSADAIICSSEKGLDRIQTLVPNTKARLLDIPNILGPCPSEQHEQLCPSSTDKGRNYADTQTVYILCVGRFHPSKRLTQLIEVCPKEIDGRPVELRLAGYSDDRAFLNMIDQKAQQSGLNLRLFPNASNEEIASLYRSSDVFVSLSNTENFGNAIGEALVAGLPVIITPHTDFWPDFDFEGVFVTGGDEVALSVEKALNYNFRNKRAARQRAFEQRWTSYSAEKFKSFEILCMELIK